MLQASEGHEIDTFALVALGSNMASPAGSPADTLRAALSALASRAVRLVSKSRFFRTPCFPPGAGDDFVNAVALVKTGLEPQALLAHLHRIEQRFARQRRGRWGARTLDLDLLDFGGRILPDAETYLAWRDLAAPDQARIAPDRLILPHPRLQDRAFVLVPLADVAPDWVHPVSGKDVSAMLADLPAAEKAEIRPV